MSALLYVCAFGGALLAGLVYLAFRRDTRPALTYSRGSVLDPAGEVEGPPRPRIQTTRPSAVWPDLSTPDA